MNRPTITFAMFSTLASPLVARGDMITVSAIEQQANMSATYAGSSHQPGEYNQAGPLAQSHEAKVLVSDGMGGFFGTTSHADQFQASSFYTLNPNSNLALRVVGSNSGSIVNGAQTSDEASLSERLEFIFQTDRELLFTMDAMIATSGDLIDVQDLNQAGNGASVVIALRNNAGSLFAVYDVDTDPTLSVATILPSDGYKLTVQSVYKVKGNPGETVMGSASYSVDFSVSAVPEPSSLGMLACLGGLLCLGHRRRTAGGG